MDQLLETLIILIVTALALAFLAKRFFLKGKQGNCSGGCNCPKPELPKRPK
jgi:hypothetical protein